MQNNIFINKEHKTIIQTTKKKINGFLNLIHNNYRDSYLSKSSYKISATLYE